MVGAWKNFSATMKKRSETCCRCQSLTGLADLHHELAVLRELQDVAVVRAAVAANPDVALVVDVDAVVGRRPRVTRTALPAPTAEQGTVGTELENRRRDLAALGGLLVGRAFDLIEHVGTMHDPHVILGIDPEPDRLALVHAVGQRLRERRIDLEPWRLNGACRLCLGRLLQRSAEASTQAADKRRADMRLRPSFIRFLLFRKGRPMCRPGGHAPLGGLVVPPYLPGRTSARAYRDAPPVYSA